MVILVFVDMKPDPCHLQNMLDYLKELSVWPQPIKKKVRSWSEIPPQHQSTYLVDPDPDSFIFWNLLSKFGSEGGDFN